MTRPLNILIMNRQFHGIFGGVEHMCTALVNEMSSRGYKCHLLSLDMKDAEIDYELNSDITWHKVSSVDAQKKANVKERFARLKKIRAILKEKNIDIAIGFQDGAFLILALAALGTGIPIIAAERNSPTRFNFTSNGKYKNLRYNSFRLSECITVQCPSYVDFYPLYLRSKIKVIPNPVFPADNFADPRGIKGERKTLLSVGRLSYQKNYMVLFEAFSLIAAKHPKWDLTIVGEGDHRDRLEKFIQEKNLQGRISLVGYSKNTEDYYRQAHLFCLPSLWEGFPNALAEAMAHSLPSIGFEACAGVFDLIEHGETGLLAQGGGDDPQALAEAMVTLMCDDDARVLMGANAKEKTKEFTPAHVYDKWEELFLNMAKG